MLRLVFRALAQATLAMAPFAWVILSYKDDKQHPYVPIGLTVAALAFIFLMDLFDLYLPHISANEFKKDYLEKQLKQWKEAVQVDGQHIDGIRFNVMYVSRRWYFLFGRFFTWGVNSGFDPSKSKHHDVDLLLHVRQGVCGIAFRENQVKFADLRNVQVPATRLPAWFPFPRRPYWLWPWQSRKVAASGVKAVLSVPLWKQVGKNGHNPRYKPVGVINIDATTDEAADLLDANKDVLAVFFADEGKFLALLPADR